MQSNNALLKNNEKTTSTYSNPSPLIHKIKIYEIYCTQAVQLLKAILLASVINI